MPAELTDVESVRQFMQKSVSDKLQDEDLKILILQASEEIERHCNRQFFPEPEATKSFEFLPNETLDLIDLKPTEYRALTTVVLDPDLTPVTLAAGTYRPYPYPSRDGTFFGIKFSTLPAPVLPSTLPAGPEMPFGTRRVDVTATWGTAAVPHGLQHWANVTVEAWAHLRRDGAAPREGQVEGTTPLTYDLPLSVVWALKRWNRPTPAA